MSTTKPTPLSCVSYLPACAFILFFPTPSSSSTLSCQAPSTPEGTGTYCLPSSYSLSSQLGIKPTSIEQNPICLGNKTKNDGEDSKNPTHVFPRLQKEQALRPLGMCSLSINHPDLPQQSRCPWDLTSHPLSGLTEVKTSVVCWMVAIFFQPHFSKSFTRVGLWSVADGCVRKNVGKRCRFDRAGELEP